ncbi:uncharacterized protein LOC6566063 [Drosophila grimshawi]|uniref:GH24368 n=1 Tax=Drosophila grimshawi TaxID=7222 RepID=B4JMA3_DROGR|nr:uncharacterized protein LOC6566063 [Drosophila grimshawi]EDV91864.1 GH24368 [Drosophila grimshawi]
MPLGRRLAIGSDEVARRQRAELRTTYGNKLSNLNLERLRHTATMASASLRRIASSFAQVSDVKCGACAALPHDDNEEDMHEEHAEILIRREPFQMEPTTSKPTTTTTTTTTRTRRANATTTAAPFSERRQHHHHDHHLCEEDVVRSRASERWAQIACTVSALFRVRRIDTATPLSELRRLREQRDLLVAFTRPFLYEDAVQPK